MFVSRRKRAAKRKLENFIVAVVKVENVYFKFLEHFVHKVGVVEGNNFSVLGAISNSGRKSLTTDGGRLVAGSLFVLHFAFDRQ